MAESLDEFRYMWRRGSLPSFLMESSPLEELNLEKWLDH